MPTSALVIIDMLKDFLDEGAPLKVPLGRKIIPRIRERISEAREKKIAVIYLCDAHRPGDAEFAYWPVHALEGTEGAKVVEELTPEESDYRVKTRRYSGFLGTDLELLLRELQVTRLLICGILTNVCVFFTAAEAMMRNYEVVVYADSVAALSLKEQELALTQLEKVLKVKVMGNG